MRSLQTFVALECMWWSAVVAGVWNAENRRPESDELPLLTFDQVLRKLGPLLPFLAFALRALQRSLMPPHQFPKPTLVQCLGVYGVMTVARWIVYCLHRFFESTVQIDEQGYHLVSDHLVLGGCLTAIFQLEIVYLVDGLIKKSTEDSGRKFGAVRGMLDVMFFLCALFFALLLFALTCSDMYYTALYFHPRFQSVLGFLVGSGFHVGAVQWLLRHS